MTGLYRQNLFNMRHIGSFDYLSGNLTLQRSELECLVKKNDFITGVRGAANLSRRLGETIFLLPRKLVGDDLCYVPATGIQIAFDDPTRPKHLVIVKEGGIHNIYKAII